VNNLIGTIKYFLFITGELTVLFLGISTVVAFTLMYIPKEKLSSWFSRRGIMGNVLGATVGSLTPFCACSTIPMTLGLLNAGSPFGPVMSFVIASPLLNPIIISIIMALMGFKAAIMYFAITFIASIVFGVTLEKAGGENYIRNVKVKSGTGDADVVIMPTIPGKLKVAFKSAWADFKAVLLYLLIGVAIGAVIYGYIPQDLIARIAGPDNPFAIPVAAIIGIPLYIRTETAIPIGMALAQKGMSLGAVIALIIGGAGMAIPEMSMLSSIFQKRLVAAIVVVIFLTAVIGGYAFNIIY
jgi:uncharacterized protein